MNGRIAKNIREIIPPYDPVSRRVYRRLKKLYTKAPKSHKEELLRQARATLASP